MDIVVTGIPGVCVVETAAIDDERGSFMRLFCENDLAQVLGPRHIVQINVSHTIRPGTIRGLHFQYPPHGELKLIRCLSGRVYDVAVDLRAGSPTFLSWHAEELSAENRKMIVIPEGCAHGFQTVSPDCELLYLHTTPYTPGAEGGVRFDDPRLRIAWPLAASGLSTRDLGHPWLPAEFPGVQA